MISFFPPLRPPPGGVGSGKSGGGGEPGGIEYQSICVEDLFTEGRKIECSLGSKPCPYSPGSLIEPSYPAHNEPFKRPGTAFPFAKQVSLE